MPRLTRKLPAYRLHRPSGRAVVTLGGKDRYLGAWNSPESRAEYDRLVAEWLVAGRSAPKPEGASPAADPSVSEVLLAFRRHAEAHDVDPGGGPSRELKNIRDALKPVRKLYGAAPARAFGPLALRAVRGAMVASGLARTTVNARVDRVRRVFKWAASVELVPASVPESLRTLDGLREGRTSAREAMPVGPVAIEHVEAALPHLPRQVAAMVRLQWRCGCGPARSRRCADATWRPAREPENTGRPGTRTSGVARTGSSRSAPRRRRSSASS